MFHFTISQSYTIEGFVCNYIGIKAISFINKTNYNTRHSCFICSTGVNTRSKNSHYYIINMYEWVKHCSLYLTCHFAEKLFEI